jgi:lipopolysaccharide transport system ATP-binding protein
MSTAIEFNNISKQYRLGLVSTRTLNHDLKRWWTVNVLRKEDPYLKIGEVNDRATKGESEYVWALRDINFKVEQGDVVGIIGRNGAGKSTLLKILSKVTGPTTGTIRARGRIGSLLEVGTGFHQEMTGRENIFLNGAILGMTKSEIARKLDEIVDFSGCERYIDTPVKRYSSGMSVRLGFAVAAFLDPEILVVDEVLAVGDAEFQKKAIGKMQDVSRSEGRTVLFVSHNMVSIQQLCRTGLLLKNGMIETSGPISDVVNIYLSNIKTVNDYNRHGNGAVKTTDFKTSATRVDVGHDIEVDFDIEAYQHVDILEAEIEIKDSNGQNLANISNTDAGTLIKPMEKGEKRHFHCLIKNINFAPGNYTANIWLGSPYATYDKVEDCIRFNVIQTEEFILRPIPYYSSYRVILQSEWDI